VTASDHAALAFAERSLELLGEGSFSATYKYALFVALLDLCLERTSRTGLPPQTLTTRQLAEKSVELYWPHATPYEGKRVLRQGGVRDGSQAELVRAVAEFRTEHAQDPGMPMFRARASRPERFERLLRVVEWKLIEMPIPRLQRLGREENRFIYEYGWDESIRQGEISHYQRTGTGFDNRLSLQPRVSEHLVRLNGLLRPLIHREWARMVAAMNKLPQSELDEFLFGATRVALDPVRAPLTSLQRDHCFYCDERLVGRADVDHFIPWARYPNNGIHNLVVAHPKCNNRKRDFLAAAVHVERWSKRARTNVQALDAISAEVG
jgi:hypothetical protein